MQRILTTLTEGW